MVDFTIVDAGSGSGVVVAKVVTLVDNVSGYESLLVIVMIVLPSYALCCVPGTVELNFAIIRVNYNCMASTCKIIPIDTFCCISCYKHFKEQASTLW